MNMQETFPTIAAAALEYAARGWHVFPARIKDGSKRSYVAGKANGGARWGATTDPDTIRDYWSRWPEALLGITTGTDSLFFVIDADTPEGHDKDGVGTLRGWIEDNGDLPHTIEATTPSGGWHLYFRWPDDLEIRNSESKLAPGIDVRGEGGMVLAPPTIKPGGTTAYRWNNPPGFFDLADCPEWLLDKIRAAQAPKLSARAMPAMPRSTPAAMAEVEELLGHVDPDAGGYGQWCDVLMALHDHTGGSGDGLALADQWSARGTKYRPGEVRSKWLGFTPGGGVTIGTVAALARQGGADLSAIARKHRTDRGGPTGWEWNKGNMNDDNTEDSAPRSNAPEPRGFEELLDASKALQPGQIEEMEAIISECAALNPMRADAVSRAIKDATKVPLGTIKAQLSQERDTTPEPDHLDLARLTLDQIGRDNVICTDAFVWRWQARGVWTEQDDRAIKQAVQVRLDDEHMVDVTANRVNGVSDVLKSEIYRPNHEFNRGNPETVNCLNGEIELHSGRWQLRPHCRENYRTTQIPVAYDPRADAPLFRAFLAQVFRDDPDCDDKIAAILELMGYTLMSHARHEKFIMLIGPGANGKSVLLAVLEGLLGSENVAGVQPANFDNRFQRAHLHQKLANIVTELKQGEVIADAELKAITSGEPATVEHKHKDPFVMRPFSTCWFGTNHMPHTRDFSEALFRRATILQFNRTFAPHEQDPQLKDKLLAELPGILNMSLTAYARALVDGFTQPQSSEEAKKEWRLEADQVALFVDDACHRDPGGKTPAGNVFQAYQSWAAENGISKTMSQKGLRDRLTRLGFGAERDRTARYVTGMRVQSWGGA